MKPLTLEQVKELKIGDWIWLISSIQYATRSKGEYRKVDAITDEVVSLQGINNGVRLWCDYGKTCLAYTNKEQAECKGEIMELPCKRQRTFDGAWEVISIHPDGFVRIENYLKEETAQRRLAELKEISNDNT